MYNGCTEVCRWGEGKESPPFFLRCWVYLGYEKETLGEVGHFTPLLEALGQQQQNTGRPERTL